MDEMQERKRAKEIDALREIKDGGINSEWHLSQREWGLGPEGFDLPLHCAKRHKYCC